MPWRLHNRTPSQPHEHCLPLARSNSGTPRCPSPGPVETASCVPRPSRAFALAMERIKPRLPRPPPGERGPVGEASLRTSGNDPPGRIRPSDRALWSSTKPHRSFMKLHRSSIKPHQSSMKPHRPSMEPHRSFMKLHRSFKKLLWPSPGRILGPASVRERWSGPDIGPRSQHGRHPRHRRHRSDPSTPEMGGLGTNRVPPCISDAWYHFARPLSALPIGNGWWLPRPPSGKRGLVGVGSLPRHPLHHLRPVPQVQLPPVRVRQQLTG